jgi:hypothetical protein
MMNYEKWFMETFGKKQQEKSLRCLECLILKRKDEGFIFQQPKYTSTSDFSFRRIRSEYKKEILL